MMETENIRSMISALSDPDQSARRAAAEELGQGDERAVYPLIKALRDKSAGVQDAAMRSLISIGGEVTAYMALPLLREGPFLRNTAMIILKEIGVVSVPLLRPLLADRDDDIRKFGVDLIGEIKQCDYPGDIIPLLSADPNPNVRASAAKTLGILGYREAVPALVVALNDEEWVCFSALEALSYIKDESTVEPIGRLLAHSSSTIRYAAIEALGKTGSSNAGEQLLNHLPKAEGAEKEIVVKSLVQIGLTPSMGDVFDVLMGMFRRGDWEDRLVALKGIAALKDESAVPVILDIAGSLDPSDPQSEERLYSVKEALRGFGCSPALIGALEDPAIKFRGRIIAIETIGEMGCREAMQRLIPLLQGKNTSVIISTIDAVAGIGGDIGSILSPLMQHGEAEVRERVARALEAA